MRKALWVSLTLSLVLAVSLPAGKDFARATTHAETPDKVSFALSWIPYATFIGFFVAVDRGYFKDENIEVAWQRGYGTPDTLRKVAVGQFLYGFANVPSTAHGRAQGLPAVSIALLTYKAPNAIMTLKGSGITKPEDLSGRSVVVTAKDALDATFPFLVTRYKIRDIKWVYVEPAAKNAMLLAGKADALLTYTAMGPILRQMAAGLGKEIVVLPWSDFGYDVVGDNIASSDTVVRDKPGLTRRFLRALLKGHAWGIDRPGEAAESIVRVNPTAKRDIEEAQWKLYIEEIRSPFVARHGLGYHDEERVRLTRDTIFGVYNIKADVPLKDIYTNAHLPSPAIVPAAMK